MPRHIPQALSVTERAVQAVRHSHLRNTPAETPVTVEYVKRDGTKSSSTGTVGEFSGKPGFDTGSVTIHDAVKGARTINLHRITRIK